MPAFEVEWSLKGLSRVEAGSEEEAMQKVYGMTDDRLRKDVTGFEISDTEVA
ncbi:MAG: hypothetical protein WC083_05990 [Candidatus Methanomethylophilaceae archaeon]|jgi:hypothetical protein